MAAIGPGSQPQEEDGASIAVLAMSDAMSTFSRPALPEPGETADLSAGKAFLKRIHTALVACRVEEPAVVLDLAGMKEADRVFLDQILGEGEVSILRRGQSPLYVQESVFTGVWRVQCEHKGEVVPDRIEVGAIPGLVRETRLDGATVIRLHEGDEHAANNILPLVTELNGKLSDASTHVINLSLLPHTEEDLAFLDRVLGSGQVSILSRGYGNCRITSTGTRRVWWVQYFNSQETLILNTLEVVDIPLVACAAQQDIEDSTRRLEEVIEVYQ